MKYDTSVVRVEFHFLFQCPAYTDYRTKCVHRKFLQPPITYVLLVDLCPPQKKNDFSFAKICTGSKQIRDATDYCHRSLSLCEHFTSVKHV